MEKKYESLTLVEFSDNFPMTSPVMIVYGRETNDAGNHSFKPFFEDHFEDHIAPEAQIKTDEWTGYLPLKKNYQNLQQIPSGKKGENFQLMHRSIMLFKAWLRGTHHAVDHLQAYLVVP